MALTKTGTDGIKDDAVTLDKLAHGTSSQDGKFLRANNGAAPSFETVSIPAGTTINNNADNRVITGSGTANTLNGESNLTYDGSTSLKIIGANAQYLYVGSTDSSGAVLVLDGDSNGDGAGGDYSFIRHNTDGDIEVFARGAGGAANTIFKQSTSEKLRIQSGGGISFNGDTAAANALDDYEEGQWAPNVVTGTISYSNAYYTKVGRLVTIQAKIQSFSNASSSSAVEIGNLPFTCGVTDVAVGSVMYDYVSQTDATTLYMNSNTSLGIHGGMSGGFNNVCHNELNSSGNNTTMFITATYQTT